MNIKYSPEIIIWSVRSSSRRWKQHCNSVLKTENEVNSFSALDSEDLQIFLLTAVILIADNKDIFHEARCLLNNGLQPSFITTELKKLNLKSERIDLPLVDANETQSTIKLIWDYDTRQYNNKYSDANDSTIRFAYTKKLNVS